MGQGRVSKEALLFVKKKKQKNFLSIGDSALSIVPWPQGGQKFFGSFFQKRTPRHTPGFST
jgi:hypothetical protein